MLPRTFIAFVTMISFFCAGVSIATAASEPERNFIGGVEMVAMAHSTEYAKPPATELGIASAERPKLILAAARKSSPDRVSRRSAKQQPKPSAGKTSLGAKDEAPAKQASDTPTDSLSARRARFLPVAGRMKPTGLPLDLVDAVITRESRYNPRARGSHGEVGLMQLLPSTARSIAREKGLKETAALSAAELVKWLEVPENNVRLGTHYLSMCHEKAKQNVAATIGCYNAGPSNMWAWKSIGYTRRYVRFVNDHIASN